jgi:hypothetical protein
MGLRGTVTGVAVVALLAGCGGTSARSSTEGTAEGDPVDPVMEQRLAVPEPKPPPVVRRPAREHGAMLARYFIADTLEYALRSGFTVDSRRALARDCTRCWSVWQRIDHEYNQGHHMEMTPVSVDAIRVRRGPITEGDAGFETSYWVVDLSYHVGELSIHDADDVISTATDLELLDRLVVSYDHFDEGWHVVYWKSIPSDPEVPILGRPAAA